MPGQHSPPELASDSFIEPGLLHPTIAHVCRVGTPMAALAQDQPISRVC